MFKEFRTLVPYLRQHRWRYLCGLLFLVLTDAGQLLIPQIIRKAVDLTAAGKAGPRAILSLCALLLGLAVLISIGRFGWRYFIHGASRAIETSLRDRFFTHLLTLPSSFYGASRTGDLMARATNDMNAVRMATGMALVAFTDGVFMTATILIILFTGYPGLALLIVLPLPAVTFMVIGFGKLIGSRFTSVQESFSRLSAHVQEAVSGIRVITSFVRERHSLSRFGSLNDDYIEKNMALIRIWGFFSPVVAFLSGLTILILLLAGGRSVLLGTLSPGEFTAALSYLQMLVWPMLGAGYTVNLLSRGAASLHRINEVLSSEPAIRNLPGAVTAVPRGTIEVRDLSFTYPGSDSPALRGISFRLERGMTLGILGRTGSGKSTLIRMFPRLLDPPPGTVFLDGLDVRNYDTAALRKAFGLVPQDTFLFSDTIRRNITFGAPDADDALVREAAEISTISRDLESFPHGLETEVGERGVTLSGGQKQRIAIARALAVRPGILILDDALSSVDTETEERILSRMRNFRQGKTTLLISHRVSTLQEADLIIVLEAGSLVESGTHAELVKKDGLYAEVFRLQQLIRQSAG